MTDFQQKLIQQLICDIFRASAEEQEEEGSQYELIQTLHALEQVADDEMDLFQRMIEISLSTKLPDESKTISTILYSSLLAVTHTVADNCLSRYKFIEINE